MTHFLGEGQLVFFYICFGLMIPFYVEAMCSIHRDIRLGRL